jgi:TatD DNase family protein
VKLTKEILWTEPSCYVLWANQIKKTIADEMLKHGFYLSFGKSVLHSLSLQSILKEFPLEKMFLETDDANFNIEELYQKTAEIKGISIENLHNKILKNLESLPIKI